MSSGILFRDILGDAFDIMPSTVRQMHSLARTQNVAGIARVRGGKNLIARFIRDMARLPPPIWRTPLHIQFMKHDDSEEWNRSFGVYRFHTIVKKEDGCMAEHMISLPVTLVSRVKADQKGFSLELAKVRFLGISLPRMLWPTVLARAYEWRGRYRFSISLSFWFCGVVILYCGYLDAPQ